MSDNSRPSSGCSGRSSRTRAGRHEDEARHVRRHLDQPDGLERIHVADLDRRTGAVEVNELPIRAGRDAHAGTSLELDLAQHPLVLEVERPELPVTYLLHQAVRALAPGGDRDAARRRRTWWSEHVPVDRSRHEVGARNSHQRAPVYRIGDTKETRVIARLLVELRKEVCRKAAEALLEERAGNLPSLHLLERFRVVDQDVFGGEEVEVLAVRRKEDLGKVALLAAGPRDGVGDRSRREVVLDELRRT